MRSKNAIKNVFTSTVLQFVVIIYGFVIPKIIISKYGSNVNGLISSITQFLAYISLLEAGIGPVIKAALYKPLATKNKKEISNILYASQKFFRRIAYIFVSYCILLCFIYPLIIKSNFDSIFTISLIIITAISIFAEYFFGLTNRLYLQSSQKNYIVSIIRIVTYIINMIVFVLLALTNCSITLIKIVTTLVFVLRPIAQSIYVKKCCDVDLKSANKDYDLKNKYDGLSIHIATVIHNNTDIVILSIFSNLINVSIYSVYAMVLNGVKSIISIFSDNIDSIFGDMIAKNEQCNLEDKFDLYETTHIIISTIIFSCTLVLIIPFIKIYTRGITDANYVNYWFSIIIVFSEYFWAIRLPYNSLIKSAGIFKEIMLGGWIEAILNITISIVLVFKFGLVGIAVGTLISIFIRMVEFIIRSNKDLLNRSPLVSFEKIFIFSVIMVINIFLSSFINQIFNSTILGWLLFAILCLLISSLECLAAMYIFYRERAHDILLYFLNRFRRAKYGK